MVSQIKVLEFKIVLDSEQKEKVDTWMHNIKSAWNRALKQLELLERYARLHTVTVDGKKTSFYAPCCPVWDFHYYYVDESGAIIEDRSARKNGIKLEVPCCSLTKPRDYIQPLITGDRYFDLQKIITEEALADAHWLLEIPSKYRSGIIQSLAVSWQEYKKSMFAFGKAKKAGNASKVIFRGRPRYKGKQDKITSIIHPNPKGVVLPHPEIKNTLRGMPKLGLIKVRGLTKRWKDKLGNIPDVSVAKILKRGEKYYLQLTGEFQSEQVMVGDRSIKPKSNSVGLDVGLKFHYATDEADKQPVKPLKAARRADARIKRLQRTINRKRMQRLVEWLKTATIEDIKGMCKTIGEKRAKAIASNPPTTIKALNCIVGKGKLLTNMELQVLKARVPCGDGVMSNREKKALNQLTNLHDKVKRQRRSFNHKLSTFLVRTYGKIAVENLSFSKIVLRPTPKKTEAGYAHNHAAQKRGLNKAFLDAGLGQLVEMIESKSKTADREFVKVDPYNTTQACGNCGAIIKKSLSTRTHACSECGFVADRDINAAINIKKVAFEGLVLKPEKEKTARKGRGKKLDKEKAA